MNPGAWYTLGLAFSASLSPSEPIEPFPKKRLAPSYVIPKRE
jgi:hypothetical protein